MATQHLSLINQRHFKDIYLNNLWLLNTTTSNYDEVRGLITSGGGSGAVSSATSPLAIANNVLSLTDIASLTFKYQTESSVALSVATNNRLLWNNVNILNGVEVLSAIANAVSIAGPFTSSMNTVVGTKQFTYDPTYQYTQLILKDSGNTARTLTSDTSGNLVFNSKVLQSVLSVGAGAFLSGTTLSGYDLRWNQTNTPSLTIKTLHFVGYTVAEAVTVPTAELQIGHPIDMATQTWANTQLALKATYTYAQKDLNMVDIGLSTIVASTHMPSRVGAGTWTNSGSYGTVSLGVTFDHYLVMSNMNPGWLVTFQMDVRLPTSGAPSNVVMFFWGSSTLAEISIPASQLSTTSFTTITLVKQFTSAISSVYWMIGAGSTTAQTAGTVHIKNFSVVRTSGKSWNTSLTLTGNLTCVSLVQTSDQRIKTSIQDVPVEDLMNVFDSTEVKSYTRTDLPGKRWGFIAQDVAQKIPDDVENLVFTTGEENQQLLALDYSRLVTVLWGVCKKQQKQIDDLIAKVGENENENENENVNGKM